MGAMVTKCEVCGKDFETTKGNKKYCGRECAEIARAQKQREWKQLQKKQGYFRAKEEQVKAEQRKVNAQRIVEIDKKARKLGMSYGKYVAMMRMRGEEV